MFELNFYFLCKTGVGNSDLYIVLNSSIFLLRICHIVKCECLILQPHHIFDGAAVSFQISFYRMKLLTLPSHPCFLIQFFLL